MHVAAVSRGPWSAVDHLHRANEAVGAGLIIHALFCQSKVCHFDVPLAIQKYILLHPSSRMFFMTVDPSL